VCPQAVYGGGGGGGVSPSQPGAGMRAVLESARCVRALGYALG